MNGCFLTNVGKVRNHNEDAGGIYKNDTGQMLAVVADGMGGHRAGDVASQMAAANLHKKWQDVSLLSTPEQSESWLEHAVQDINSELFHYASEHEECQGMGTTIVIAICTKYFTTIAHIGDSRCYLANAYGFKQITEDHSLVNELVRSGQITEEQAEHHPRKNVLLKALGTENQIDADIKTYSFEQDDRLLLCSDGLTNKVKDEELAELLTFEGEWSDFCQKLIDKANDRGGEDNITLAVVHYTSTEGKEGADEC
ncbi:Stp1/IreP family PP2C-type Ser/Thr phosphatase [Halobacillus salinarum]|uniref:Stp1/IreP family PP2C-type Ser/Thr phosphatase n=1 Tax=Halobacillus salinarum TaxID=2932257 RepID=A0ABY4EF72_9BACI|nr:Stp1/IreP family PP2C-type Ser/Thr phosphatase [Halobacillus salinarum]UOQ43102.1 Stp1/IreP family PP2C-type Ser/Thr phosphatase [Halobacillus salinarum]